MTQRDQLHALVEEIPEAELPPAVRFMEFLKSQAEDPFLLAHRRAPDDDEPITEDDLRALEEGLEDLAGDRTLSQAQVRQQLPGGS